MNCSVVNMQLARDGAGAPLLDVIVAQDLRLEFGSDGHGSCPVLCIALRTLRKTRPRSGPRRTNAEQAR